MATTRDPTQIPFASDSVFNLPLGTGAQWIFNQQLAGSNIVFNTNGNFNENIWTGTSSDPLVTVTNTAGSGGTPGTFQVHIPVGAVPAGGADQTFSVDDTATHTWYGFGGWNWTGTNTATVAQGSGESDFGSGIQVDGSDWDQGVGTLRASDLAAGSIDHMLRIELPFDMLKSWGASPTVMAPFAWPQTQEDGFGPSTYTGTVPYGVTIGIAQGVAEPATVANNAGANMLWHELQNHGAIVRDSGNAGPNSVIFQTDQGVDASNPVIQGMEQFGAQIMGATQILGNQGPNSVNGGGTPVAPLDAAPADNPGGVGGGGTPPPPPVTTPGASPSGTVIMPGSGSFVDTLGHTYSLTAGDVAMEDGQAIINGGGTGEMAFVNSVVLGEDAASKQWYTWNQTTWTATAAPVLSGSPPPPPPPPPPTTVPGASPSGTVITPGSGSFVDSNGHTYTLDAGGSAIEDGKQIPGGGGTAEMAFVGGQVDGEDAASHNWFAWNQTTWTAIPAPNLSPTTPPPPPPPDNTFVLTGTGGITLSLGDTGGSMKFVGFSAVTLTAGSVAATVTADGGANTWVDGSAILTATGGQGADAYVEHLGGGGMVIKDFSSAKGDTLTLDQALQSRMVSAPDGSGGTSLSFGGAAGVIDLKGVSAVPAIHWT